MRKGYKVPSPVETVDGTYYVKRRLKSGDHVIRLMVYIPGKTLVQTENITKSSGLFYDVGRYAAKLDGVMKVNN